MGYQLIFSNDFFFFSSSDARQVTLLSDLDGEKLCRNIRYWRYIYIYICRIFLEFLLHRDNDIIFHSTNISCLEVIFLFLFRCIPRFD